MARRARVRSSPSGIASSCLRMMMFTAPSGPMTEISVMGPDGAVNIIMRKQLEAIPEGDERTRARLAMAEEISKTIDPYIAAGHAQVDDIIDPADTRSAIWHGLQLSRDKVIEAPWRTHGVLPV